MKLYCISDECDCQKEYEIKEETIDTYTIYHKNGQEFEILKFNTDLITERKRQELEFNNKIDQLISIPK